MEFAELKHLKSWRDIEKEEIVFDCDNKQGLGELGIVQVGAVLQLAGYNFEVWKAQGQKSPHLHIKGIPHLNELTLEQNKLYKDLFLKKIIAKAKELFGEQSYFNDFDFSLCGKHTIAEENKPHYKYGTIKELLLNYESEQAQFCDKEIYEQAIKEIEPEYKLLPAGSGTGITAEARARIGIVSIAQKFGLEVTHQGMAVCPFHPDSNPSLKFYAEQGRFYCFGCQAHGNIIYFFAMLKKLNPRFKLK